MVTTNVNLWEYSALKTVGTGITLCLETKDIEAAGSKAMTIGIVAEGQDS